MDRFEEIKLRYNQRDQFCRDDIDWLINEIERLKKKLPTEWKYDSPPEPPEGMAYCNVCGKLDAIAEMIYIQTIGYMCYTPCKPDVNYKSLANKNRN